MLYQILKAPNDINGNPRRLTMCYSANTGKTVAVIDHGYEGDKIPSGGTILETIIISGNEYRCLLTKHQSVLV